MARSGEIFPLWQAAQGSPGSRAIRLLATAGTADPGALKLGEAARRLVALRAALFGPVLEAVADCPACGIRHEAAFPAALFTEAEPGADRVCVEAEGWRVEARCPTLGDFADAAACPDAEAAEALLRQRAILSVQPPDAETEMPGEVLAAVEAELDAVDPLADARIALTCANCAAEWEAGFEAAAFLADELAAASRRLIAEVVTLARAFGWTEQEVLAIPPERRRVYLELAG